MDTIPANHSIYIFLTFKKPFQPETHTAEVDNQRKILEGIKSRNKT
jgi:hypothetical protein